MLFATLIQNLMKPQISVIFALFVLLAGCAETSVTPRTPPRDLTKSETGLVAADNGFGFSLLKKLNAGMADRNVVISPISVSMALGMTLNGANGTTETAMRSTLGFDSLSRTEINGAYRSLIDLLRGLDPSVKFQIANSIWHRNQFQADSQFIADNSRYFDAQTQGLDFADPSAGKTINDWVKGSTGGKIEKIVPDQIPAEAVMYLINAIYFKGAWTTKFDPKLTYDGEFTLADNTKIPCRMMTRSGKVRTMSSSSFTAVDLPYGDAGFSMTILLPTAGTADDLVESLKTEDWNNLVEGFHDRETVLSMPKFTIDYGNSLNDALKAMGMEVAFQYGTADFTRINSAYPAGELYISNVNHKTFIDVNEEGTEAAAATSVEISTTSAPAPIRIDRPFVFAIRENHSGTILFLGKVARV
jgi:serpin B